MAHTLLIVDTETGGLDPAEYSILSLGAVVWRDGEAADSFEVFVAEPEILMEPEAMGVNRIDVEWLRRNGLGPRDAVAEFHRFLERNFDAAQRDEKISLAGHNVFFDVGFMRRLYRLSGYSFDEVFSHRFLDTASVVNFLILSGRLPLKEASSSAAFRYFNISVEHEMRHTALTDAKATARLLSSAIELVRA